MKQANNLHVYTTHSPRVPIPQFSRTQPTKFRSIEYSVSDIILQFVSCIAYRSIIIVGLHEMD